jgi:hypothetical protein
MENESIGKIGMGINYKGSQDQTKRAIVLQEEEVDEVVCAPDDGWNYHPKHVEQFPDISKLCNIASCWIYL